METYKDQCIKLLQVIPDADGPQIEAIAQQVGCSERTAYRAKADVQASIAMSKRKNVRKSMSKKKKASKKRRTKSKKKKGKRGPKKKSPSNIQVHPIFQKKQPIVIPRIPPDMTFEHFSKYHSYPHYDGLYRWQYVWFNKVWPADISVTTVSREHGKSIGLAFESEWAMTAQNYDILYLGWTDRRKEVAAMVYDFFFIRNELIIDKASSNYHFKTIYGTSFDTYLVKAKAILGMHSMGVQDRQIVDENRYLEEFVRNTNRPLLLIIDDPIDNTFREERHKEEKLENFFDSTIMGINPDKMQIAGTKKFEEDFFHFIEKKFDDIVIFKSSPLLDKTDPRYDQEVDNPCNLLCPEHWIVAEDPLYQHYLSLRALKRAGTAISTFTKADQLLVMRQDLTRKKRNMNQYWWFAEYMQDPHPITGEVWQDLRWETNFRGTAFYDLIIISIDRATTQNKKSDYTGITVTFREKEVYERILQKPDGEEEIIQYQKYTVMKDFTMKIRITDLVQFTESYYKQLRIDYRYFIRIITVVEKQGGGDDFCDLAEDGGKSFASTIIRIHTTRNKYTRIEDNLGTPIKEGDIGFMDTLKDSELIIEIGTFPYCRKIDALDSLSNAFFEAEKQPRSKVDLDKFTEQLKQYNDSKTKKNPFQQMLNQHNTRRTIF